MQKSKVANIVLCLSFIVLIAACSKDQSGEVVASAVDDPNPVGQTREYDWYMEGATPAGESTIVRTGDGRITNESFRPLEQS